MPKKRNETLIRVFGGRTFLYQSGHAKKSDAKKRAQNIRKKGELARVVKGSRGWEVYSRPKW